MCKAAHRRNIVPCSYGFSHKVSGTNEVDFRQVLPGRGICLDAPEEGSNHEHGSIVTAQSDTTHRTLCEETFGTAEPTLCAKAQCPSLNWKTKRMSIRSDHINISASRHCWTIECKLQHKKALTRLKNARRVYDALFITEYKFRNRSPIRCCPMPPA